MAKLISEDKEIISSLELSILTNKLEERQDLSWVPYSIILRSASNELIFSSESSVKGAGDYVFAIKPVNEIDKFIANVQALITEEEKKLYSFEPLEPSIEVIFERSHKGYSVTIWLDAGNVISNHYTWDGFGLRFFTSENNIKLFMSELKDEMEEIGSSRS